MKDLTVETDNELFARIQNHDDAQAFRVLYGRYKRRIFAYCLQIVKDEESAKDAFQTTFAAVYEQRMSYTPGTFSSWLFTIAKRTAMRVWTDRRATRLPVGEVPIDIEELIDEHDATEVDVYLLEALRKAINRLGPDYKEAVELRYFQGLAFEEIAQTLGISLSLAKVRVTRAKQMLQRLMNLEPDDIS
ncbi:sigma-70 family RNA polymerase sigma factor [soil metagenome]